MMYVHEPSLARMKQELADFVAGSLEQRDYLT